MAQGKKPKNYKADSKRQAERKAARAARHASRYAPVTRKGTLTAALRTTQPEKYARKDARNAVLRAVYGQMTQGQRISPVYETFDGWRDAFGVVQSNLPYTGWPLGRIQVTVADMQRLNPKNQKPADMQEAA